MKGRATSAADKRLHNQIAALGCIACRLDGNHNPVVSIHHIDGRTKPGAHERVLPLCGPHHQDTGHPEFIAVHPWKRRFEQKYGSQIDLLRMCMAMLDEQSVQYAHSGHVLCITSE